MCVEEYAWLGFKSLYLIPTTIEQGPARFSTDVWLKPAACIHDMHSLLV